MCLYCMYIVCVDHLSPTSCCCCKPLWCRLAGASCCRQSERKVRCWVTNACGVTQSVLLPCPPPHRALCPLPCFSVSVCLYILPAPRLFPGLSCGQPVCAMLLHPSDFFKPNLVISKSHKKTTTEMTGASGFFNSLYHFHHLPFCPCLLVPNLRDSRVSR